jgi:hypothetical protein
MTSTASSTRTAGSMGDIIDRATTTGPLHDFPAVDELDLLGDNARPSAIASQLLQKNTP